MVCIYCGLRTAVVNSRHQKRQNQIWRRRKCLSCGAIFTSHESANYNALLQVKATNGQLQAFSRDKLFLSLYNSLQHRPEALDEAAGLSDTVIGRIARSAEEPIINVTTISHVVCVALLRFDRIAANHYQAFHG
ncbi:MAG TPA: hypothetical protein VNE40_04905 [Candidatus Dormibacteraeota bacterium]|nr:hypothetical protein [Candidatus Dormibacteraeota bacterium]